MTEMRLPKRLVLDLRNVIYKKTSGHALFVAQLLNSLVRDSTISYSPQKWCFHWNWERVSSLRTWDSVAGFIVSNLSSLQPGALLTLRIVSCFGTLLQLSLLELLDSFPRRPNEGIVFFLPSLVEKGVLEKEFPMIVFSHDLIQQQVYESMGLEQRQRLHLDLGIFLGSKTTLDRSETIEADLQKLDLSEKHNMRDSAVLPLSLGAIATEQINNAGPEFIHDHSQRIRFAGWNLKSGKLAISASNFRAAFHYYERGIGFLHEQLWLKDTYSLCLQLNDGAAYALYALGRATDSGKYARSIIDKVPFEDSLAAQLLLLRSYEFTGDNEKIISEGLAILRKVGIDFTAAPSLETVKEAMNDAKLLALQHDFDQIPTLHEGRVCERTRNVLKIMDAVSIALLQTASPYLPMLASAMVSYSLQHGVCEESAHAFAVYAYFTIHLFKQFKEARRYGNIALKILENAQNQRYDNPITVLFRPFQFKYNPS